MKNDAFKFVQCKISFSGNYFVQSFSHDNLRTLKRSATGSLMKLSGFLFLDPKIGQSFKIPRVRFTWTLTRSLDCPTWNIGPRYFINFMKLSYEIKAYEIGVTLGHLKIT